VAIGTFDGVHRGHRAVIEAAVAKALHAGLRPLVLTFHPHPIEVLGRGRADRLTTLERKIELIGRIDPQLGVVVEPFTLELSNKTPREFAEELLVGQLGARRVIVGSNFRFGHGRAGDLATLDELGRELGFEASAEPLSGDERGPFSSSRAREALLAGDLAEVEHVLGRPHSLSGVVVEGDRRGRTIGVPTANIADVPEVLPPYGVYATLVDRLQADGTPRALAAGVSNVGERPTVSGGFSFETHLFDFQGDLYGAELRVHLIGRLRAEQHFAGLDELKAQIERDQVAAKKLLVDWSPDPDANGAWY
jgi:riboflavin kinase / FMN adenylyltransferase